MYTIEIEKECGCVKKNGFEKVMTFESREDMYNKARILECRMNQEFCMKHFFEAVDYGDKIVIHSSERPEDDEDDLDVEDAGILVRKNAVTIGFNGAEEPPKNSNSN